MAAPSTEQRELQLVDTVDFRILGVANKEDKLQELLQKYLAPLLLKAGSEHASVRGKVIQIVARIKTFIQPPGIVLPMDALLGQYKSQASPLVKQLDLTFLQHSLERIDDYDRRQLLPKALAGFAQDDGQQRAGSMFQIILRLLLDMSIPPRGSKDDEAFRSTIGLEQEADAKYLAKMLGSFLRLRAPSANATWASSNPTLTQQDLASLGVETLGSQTIFRRLSELKAKVVAFLASGAFTDQEKFLPALYASASFDNRVASGGDEILKRTTVSLEDKALVKTLFEAHGRMPAAHRIQILDMLSKSAVSATMSEEILQTVSLDLTVGKSAEGQDSTLAPSSALEQQKLANALFRYLSWVARISSNGKLAIGSRLIKDMMEHITKGGWPVPKETTQDQSTLRSKAYETIGLVARSAQMSANDRVTLAGWLFKSLSEDPTHEAVVNIDEALSSLTSMVPPDVGGKMQGLKRLLLHYMQMPDRAPAVRSTRHAVVKWANQCLPFSDLHARWIDVMAIAGRPGERSEVIEQGHKGLDPWTYFAHQENDSELPDWREMLLTFFGPPITAGSLTGTGNFLPSLIGGGTNEESMLDVGDDLLSDDIGGGYMAGIANFSPEHGNMFDNYHGGRIKAFPVALRYCKQIMLLTPLKLHVEPNWMQTLDAQIATDLRARDTVRKYLDSGEASHVLVFLMACIQGALLQDSPFAEEALRCFVEIVPLCHASWLSELATYHPQLEDLLTGYSKEVRYLAAKVLGILAPHPSCGDEAINWDHSLSNAVASALTAHGPDLNTVEGAVLAFGYIRSRAVYYDNPVAGGDEYPLNLLVEEPIATSLYDAALESFSQLWSAGLALPPSTGPFSIDKIIEGLSTKAKKGNEKAIIALGRLALCIDEPPLSEGQGLSEGTLGTVLTRLLALDEIKQVEVHFAVGEALAAAVACWKSDCMELSLDVEPIASDFRKPARSGHVKALLEKLINDCKSTKPSLLKASGVWLFCLVQYCSHLEEIQARLRDIQVAFMRLLSARDELVQETASRGLSLVYERGDADLKADLVKDLVSTFTGSGPKLKVDQETELFEPGALPTGEGSSITSYKDIVSLANEVGDQRLVYKFMALATNAAAWSTRSAFGRFGLSNILSDSTVDPKLYPKLFRYRFDPNTNVQRSMDDIWKALVKDPGAVLDKYFDEILEDLLKSILGREWRMREASCAAISDLLQGRKFGQYEKRYRLIWTSALKVLDDVKGSVRAAALKLCMSLSKSLVRELEDAGTGWTAKAMMDEALPFLLSDKGMENSVQDVQLYATTTVLQIAKKGGQSLKPFISDMVPRLLGLLSTIEPQQINWHYQRMGEDTRDELDRLRSRMVNQSPISEAIDNCLRFVDEKIMAELAPQFENVIKTAIGLPTKIGCSKVLTTLFTRHAEEIKPLSNKFLQLMEKQVLDKNDEVSKSYARATAYMMRVAPDKAKQRFLERFMTLYFESEEETRRQKVADVVVSLAKISPDHFTALDNELLPFAYLGSHDVDEYTGGVFKEVWEQHASSNRTVVRYVKEIVSLVERGLETTQWGLRHTAALTVAAMVADVASASDTTGEIAEGNLKIIWPVLDKALALKTFDGKEKLLESWPDFVEKGKSLWKNDAKVAALLKKVAIREAKRNNAAYRVHAFRSLWRFAKARDDLDMLQEIVEIVTPHLDEFRDEDKMEVDSKEDHAASTAKNGVEAIARGYSRSKIGEAPASILGDIIKTLRPYFADAKFDAIRRELWYDAVCDLMTEASAKDVQSQATVDGDRNIWAEYLESLGFEAAETGTESQRVRRADALLAMVKARKKGVFGDIGLDMSQLSEDLKRVMGEERSADVQKQLKLVQEELH
ncbi:proteasome stabiliser-domain-containing protein [Stachybotrys elegans]|uniref:Proteasome stabiliser-domain-containing protein n=1 Tax=Stachybotrys elegans TaxID=80388 RepID=A0A8K0WPS7_9HYPO|nr:proteasome stabiliser-domain-containing protein [Stachybotrys elegans]